MSDNAQYLVLSIKDWDWYDLTKLRFHFYKHTKTFDPYVYSATAETRQLAWRSRSRISHTVEIELTEITWKLHGTPAVNFANSDKYLFQIYSENIEEYFSLSVIFFSKFRKIDFEVLHSESRYQRGIGILF